MRKNIRTRIALIALGGVLIFLAAAAPDSWAQGQNSPSKLTPRVDSAAPGESFRVDISPGIGRDRTEGMRMVLRPSRAQGPQSDLVLRIAEYHGAWFLIRMPQEARPAMGPGRLLLVNPRGDIMASSGDALFRILSAPRAGQVAPGSGGAAAATVPNKAAPAPGPDPRQGREEPRTKSGMTTPGVSGQARENQGLTTPGVSGKARRLPTPVTDYVGIGTREIMLNDDRKPSVSVFSLPSDVRLEGHAVLTFMANPTGTDVPMLFVSINGHEIKRLFFREGAIRACQIRFDARTNLVAGRNELEFRIREASFESIRIDEIVLWFHRDIEW